MVRKEQGQVVQGAIMQELPENNKKKRIITLAMAVLIFSTVPTPALAKHRHRERWYQQRWCQEHGGRMEARLPDGTRVDCLTATHAIEVDFARKFYEAIGQSLYYSLQTGKRAGIILILECPAERKYWLRLNSTIQYFHLPVDTWEVQP